MFFKRNFFPFFSVQFFGAFNDNVFKNAYVILIVYVLAAQSGGNPSLLVTLAAGVFILPFFLFAGTAEKVCVKYPNTLLVRRIKIAEILIMLMGSAGFLAESNWILMGVLFLMGTQSAFFGPLKYSMLPALLKDERTLVMGNAFFSGGTFLAILFGTIAGSHIVLMENGVALISAAILFLAFIGWFFSRQVPEIPFEGSSETCISLTIFGDIGDLLSRVGKNRLFIRLILANSWFWFIGATILSQLPTFFGHLLKTKESVFTFNLSLFSIGIGLGSLIGYRLNRGGIKTKYGFPALIVISIALVDFYFAYNSEVDAIASTGQLVSFAEFYSSLSAVRMTLDLAIVSLMGGIYFLPLITLLETRSNDAQRPGVISATNFSNALFMVVSAVYIAALQFLEFSIPHVFLSVAGLNLCAAFLYRKTMKSKTD